MKFKKTSLVLAFLCSVGSVYAQAQFQPQIQLRPLYSNAAANNISAAAIAEMDLIGMGGEGLYWIGVAQYGNGPMQAVLEIQRGSKWMGPSCLKFINMKKTDSGYVVNTGNYIITYEHPALATSGSFADQPDGQRYKSFDRVLTIQRDDSVWQVTTSMQNNKRQVTWTDELGQVRSQLDVVTAMKPLQETPHCSI